MFTPRTAAGVALVLALVATSCAPGEEEDTFRVGLILVGARDDLGYNQAIWEGADELARALPDVEVVRVEDVAEDSTAIDAMEALIADGTDVIFATSFGHYDQAVEIARRHPEVTVVHQGATPPVAELENFGTYFGAHSEAAYGAGVLAGHATSTRRLGFVVAFPIPATHNNVNAFTLGAQSVDPGITTHVAFTDDWCDPDEQARLAEILVTQAGVDVIAQHQDCTGTILALSDGLEHDVVGYHADGSEVAGDRWLIGAVWTWGELYEDIVRSVLNLEFGESPYRTGFVGTVQDGDNPFVLTEPGPAATTEGRQALQAAFGSFRDGSATAFDGPIVDVDGRERVAAGASLTQAEIDGMDWFVEGVVVQP